MIFKEFSHIGIGDTGEGIIRHALHNNVVRAGILEPLNGAAHVPYSRAISIGGGEPFTSVRNPFDWYISYYIHQLRNHRWQGTFRKWFHTKRPNFTETWHYFTDPGIPAKNVIRIESLETDFARILPQICDLFTPEMVRSWFPDAYRQWSNRPWVELIEQWMREELYDDEMLEEVREQDAELLDKWGYDFGQHYDMSDMHA